VTVDSAPIVSLREVRRDYALGAERVHALQGVSLDVERGDYVAIVGPSGCGKSTLLNLIGVIDQPTSGTVTIAGKRVDAMSDREATSFRLHNIGFVFQRFYLMPILSALENVALPMAEAKVKGDERNARAAELLAYVGLSSRERHRPSELSGGEQQRVAIARALANHPALLLADEPTGELDEDTGEQVADLFDRVHADGTSIVVVTHNPVLAARARRRLTMRRGTVVDA
jgi:putative ABC transport system ATP-binding protein